MIKFEVFVNWKLLLSIIFDVSVIVLVVHFAGWWVGALVGVWGILWAVRITGAVLDSVHEEYSKRFHDALIRQIDDKPNPELKVIIESIGSIQLPDLPKDLDKRNPSI